MSQARDEKILNETAHMLTDAVAVQASAPLWRADRSCCCSAPPAFTVVVASKVPTPHSVDLLLCRHHYRQNRTALEELGALVLAADGHVV